MFSKVGYFFYHLARLLSRLVSNGYGITRLDLNMNEVKNKDTHPVLIVANHVSFTDPLFYTGLFPKRQLMYIASELVINDKNKLKSFLLIHTGCIRINRNIYDIEGIRKATEALKKGHSVLIFPEGTLHHENSEELSEIKSGAILLAVQAGVPIIPAYSLKRKHWYGKRVVVVGEEFKISDYTSRKFPTVPEMDVIASALMNKINECREVYEKYEESKSKGKT